jgi:hypothetical protein
MGGTGIVRLSRQPVGGESPSRGVAQPSPCPPPPLLPSPLRQLLDSINGGSHSACSDAGRPGPAVGLLPCTDAHEGPNLSNHRLLVCLLTYGRRVLPAAGQSGQFQVQHGAIRATGMRVTSHAVRVGLGTSSAVCSGAPEGYGPAELVRVVGTWCARTIVWSIRLAQYLQSSARRLRGQMDVAGFAGSPPRASVGGRGSCRPPQA